MKGNEIKLILDGILKENKKRKIHITLMNRRFYNGIVVNYDDEESISIIDEKLGYITFAYSQILNIEPMIERK